MIVYASPRSQGVDVDGNTHAVSIIGSELDTLKVGDLSSSTYLGKILKQLKIMNIHMSSLTDMVIENSDIED